ncbi:uncharacterized protein LOC101235326 isoform X1 [Hydra vulgaris]|uniref:uncharacterized protein LOC101235326 isoform X1 n=1 Tax=Hydra vulgaris TaxID=6087 RepID=UPI001F5EEE9E|nr:uncharacterized protein LOC101235326 [Hydra vulgaris]
MISIAVLHILLDTALSDVIPIRYNSTYVNTFNDINIADIPFITVFSYTQILDENSLFNQNMDDGCYHKNEELKEPAKNYRSIQLKNPKIRHFKVLDTFHSSGGDVKVEFYTTWESIENATFLSFVNSVELSRAFTLKVNNDPDSVGYLSNGNYATNCKNIEYYSAPSVWCRVSEFYKDKIIKGGSFMFNNQCVINYEIQNKKFINMWKPSSADIHFRKQCITLQKKLNYNDSIKMKYQFLFNSSCTQSCLQNFYKVEFETNGIALVSKLVVGNSLRNNSLDLNFTVIFKKWTFPFVEVFCNAYAYCDFPYNGTTLEILMEIQDYNKYNSENGIAFRALVWVLFMFVPAFMIITALIFCFLTRSRSKGFVLTVWQYWKKRNYSEGSKSSNSLS